MSFHCSFATPPRHELKILALSIISILCGIFQIVGLLPIALILLEIIPKSYFTLETRALYCGIYSLAPIMKILIPLPNHQTLFNFIVAIAGFGVLIIMAVTPFLPSSA